MEFDFTKRAIKEIGNINEPTKTRILKAIYNLPKGDVSELRGHKGIWRLRVGGWRVMFSYSAKDMILIEKAEPRGQIYKGV